jgi:iron-sulfur cluster repair protein YtfE (RIC family)
MSETKTNFDTIVDQHQQLRRMIAELRAFLEEPRPEVGAKGSHSWASSLTEMLLRLHDKLFRHFREEERSGFLDELEREYPRAMHEIATLRSDHDRLLGDLRAILSAGMTYAEGKQPGNPQLRRWVVSLLDQISQHESEETELMQRLLVRDIGRGG